MSHCLVVDGAIEYVRRCEVGYQSSTGKGGRSIEWGRIEVREEVISSHTKGVLKVERSFMTYMLNNYFSRIVG
jgi:hypothetical protein